LKWIQVEFKRGLKYGGLGKSRERGVVFGGECQGELFDAKINSGLDRIEVLTINRF